MRLFIMMNLIIQSALAQWIQPPMYYNFFDEEGKTSGVICKEINTSTPPFTISDADQMGWKTYENFRSKDDYRKKENIIPRRSIVKIKESSADYADHPDAYIPVEVLSVAETDVHDEKLSEGRLRSASGLNNYQRLSKVQKGKKGFVYSKSLKRADEYTYILKEDSPILDDNGLTGMGVVAIMPVKAFGSNDYLVEKCCDESSLIIPAVPDCTTRYKFKLVYKDGEQGEEIYVDINSCGVIDNLIPFKNKEIVPLMNHITLAQGAGVGFDETKIEFIDEKGMVKMPLKYEEFDGNGIPGPYGSYHYNADDTGASDAYGKPLTTCAFMKVLKKHQQVCTEPGCQVQFGDMFHLRDWGPHNYHGAGKCIDIRPLKTEDSKMSATYRSSIYDREKTRKFIQLLKKAGGTSVVFDDPQISGVARTDNQSHANHIHVCFDPRSKVVKKTCYEGLD